MSATKELERYPFNKRFESQVVLAEISIPRFHDMVGHALEPDRMPSAEAIHLVRAAQAVARETGAGCPSATLALQNLRTLVHDGKLRMEDVNAASDFVDLAEDLGGVDDVDALVQGVIPVVQRFLQQDALQAAFDDFGKGNGVHETADRFEKVAALGKRKGTLGQLLQGSSEDIKACAESIMRDPLPTGVPELDEFLKGGLERGSMGCAIGGEGSGKSLFLCHLTAEALLHGYDCAYMTLELGEANVKNRIYSNLVGMTKTQLAGNPDEAERRLAMLKRGNLIVSYQTPKATTAASVRRWLKDVEAAHSFSPKVIVIDYADKLVSKLETQRRGYEEMEIVYDFLRDMNIERDGWLWTASQMVRGGARSKKPDLDDVSDSKHKVRTPDLVVTLVRTEQDKQEGIVSFRVPKRRNEQAYGEVGPLPVDGEHGRIVATCRPEPWRKR
jgi:replicative DNA helicase